MISEMRRGNDLFAAGLRGRIENDFFKSGYFNLMNLHSKIDT